MALHRKICHFRKDYLFPWVKSQNLCDNEVLEMKCFLVCFVIIARNQFLRILVTKFYRIHNARNLNSAVLLLRWNIAHWVISFLIQQIKRKQQQRRRFGVNVFGAKETDRNLEKGNQVLLVQHAREFALCVVGLFTKSPYRAVAYVYCPNG